MNVRDAMSAKVHTCGADDSLARAAQAMWDADCGCLPVVGDGNRLVGVITDRDICMSALFGGSTLRVLTVGDAMSKTVHSCRADDPLTVAEHLMRTHQIRRLPVVDAEEQVVGILSLNDIARAFGRERASGGVTADEVADTLCGVCQPWEHARAA